MVERLGIVIVQTKLLLVFFSLILVLTIASQPHAQMLPALPAMPTDLNCGPTTGATIAVGPSDDFQAALNSAALGDRIVLTSGAVFRGPFILPKKTGSGWITITGGFALPTTRISPANRSLLPKFEAAQTDGFIFVAARGAHHYCFVGIEMRPVAGAFLFSLVNFGYDRIGIQYTSISDLPHHIVFDRVYMHGDPSKGSRRGIALNAASVAVINSYFSDFKEVGADTQALCAWTAPGPFKIVNNYLEAAGENVMFGGSASAISGVTPSDIEIRNNTFAKPVSWRIQDPSYAGTPWSVKNLFELKHAQRVLVEGNVFEYTWTHGQNHAIVLTPRSESGANSWAVVQDITFRNNIVRHVQRVLNMSGMDGGDGVVRLHRVLFENNLSYDVDTTRWGLPLQGDCCNGAYQIMSRADQIVINHNTLINNTVTVLSLEAGPMTSFVYTNNIARHNTYGANGTASLEANAPGYIFTKNVFSELAGSGFTQAMYPSNNFFPLTVAAIDFVDYNNGDYHLAVSSPYRNAATDGKNIGVDFNVLTSALTGTPVSGPTPSMTPTTSSTSPSSSPSNPPSISPPPNPPPATDPDKKKKCLSSRALIC
jgi:hypothetical protein